MTTPRRRAALLHLAWMVPLAFLFVRECVTFMAGALPRTPPFPFPASAALTQGLLHALRAAGVLLFALGAMPAGRILFRTIGLKEDAAESRRWIETAAGLALYGTAAYLLAAFGFASPRLYRFLSLWGMLAGLRVLFKRDEPFRPSAWRWRRLRSPFAAGILLFLGLAGAATLLPETFGDSLHYVLALPAAALKSGRWTGIEGLCSSGFPALGPSLYLFGLSWGDERLCKLMNGWAGVFWLRMVYCWTKGRWGEEAAGWAALLLIGTPVVSLYLWSATTDILCGLLLTAAFLLWNEAGADEVNGRSGETAAFFLLGCAAAAKYTALFALPFFALRPMARLPAGRRAEAGALAGCFLALALPLLPGWISNAFRYGNPFFPYAAAWFGNLPSEAASGLAAMLADQKGDPSFLGRAGKFLQSQVTGVRTGRVGFIGPALLLLLPAAARMSWKQKGPAREPALFLLITLAVFLGTTGRVRFIVPFLGVYMILLGAAASRLAEEAPWKANPFRWVLGLTLSVQFAALATVFLVFHQGYAVLAGRQSADDYLSAPHPSVYPHPSHSAYRYLAGAATGPSEKIYLLGETRSFRCPVPAHVNTLYDVPLYERRFRGGLAGRRFIEELRAEGFTYWLVNPRAMEKDVAERYKGPDSAAKLNEVLGLLSPPVYRDEWTALYKIPDA